MIRTTVIPSDNNILLTVPEEYVGKRVEVIIFHAEEVNQPLAASLSLKPSQLRGFLSNDSAEAMLQHIEQSRNEWDIL